FNDFLNEIDPQVDTALLTFKSDSPSYSYVKTSGSFVEDIKEKDVISHEAVCGCYYFSSGEKLINIVNTTIERLNIAEEIFLSDVIKTSVLEKKSVKAFETETHVSLGTPDELAMNSVKLPRL